MAIEPRPPYYRLTKTIDTQLIINNKNNNILRQRNTYTQNIQSQHIGQSTPFR